MNIPTHIAQFWQAYVESQSEDPTPHFFEAFHFDDNERSADELAQLVLIGRKRASAGLVWSFEAASVPLPRVGDLSVVTNWAKRPVCIIETQRVDVVPFDEVSGEFAATEGERITALLARSTLGLLRQGVCADRAHARSADARRL